ncbi:hypothetical protein LIER_06059 [Lithospermum erythrorhizon]|uniref:Secreted protein n=1 Tax=Lithospermum erythrorhizon TaxID=34254 RepID=A0AAV3P449_LITER
MLGRRLLLCLSRCQVLPHEPAGTGCTHPRKTPHSIHGTIGTVGQVVFTATTVRDHLCATEGCEGAGAGGLPGRSSFSGGMGTL